MHKPSAYKEKDYYIGNPIWRTGYHITHRRCAQSLDKGRFGDEFVWYSNHHYKGYGIIWFLTEKAAQDYINSHNYERFASVASNCVLEEYGITLISEDEDGKNVRDVLARIVYEYKNIPFDAYEFHLAMQDAEVLLLKG